MATPHCKQLATYVSHLMVVVVGVGVAACVRPVPPASAGPASPAAPTSPTLAANPPSTDYDQEPTAGPPKPTVTLPLSSGAPAAAPASAPYDAVSERAASLREAASLLEKAGAARDRGNKSFAEQLFSSAELIVGPEALADLATTFRAGAPPRVTAPTQPVPKNSPPQPVAVGNSEVEHPEPRPKKGALAGTILVDGKPPAGELGVVTLEPADHKFAPPLPLPRVVEQRDRTFAPHLLVVPVGSIVTFPNFDPVYHNVFSRSAAKAFDLGLYKNAEARAVVFDKEGIVRIGCNLHANMSAWVVVVSAPHYVVTDATGHFEFNSLEPGKYVVKAWSERSTAPITQTVEVKGGKNTVSIGMAADVPAGPQPDKFGEPRGGGKSK